MNRVDVLILADDGVDLGDGVLVCRQDDDTGIAGDVANQLIDVSDATIDERDFSALALGLQG